MLLALAWLVPACLAQLAVETAVPVPQGIGAAAVPYASPQALPAAVETRPLETLPEFRVGAYNVLNLFEKVGNHDPAPGGGLRRTSDPVSKTEEQLRGAAKAILDTRLDIVALQEVENVAALERFNRDFLGSRYRTFLIEGNDPRGIDVGFLVKKDLPLELEPRTHKDEEWDDPVLGRRSKVFSRDLPSLVVRKTGEKDPLFVLFGTHMKSLRTRDPRDPQSRVLRRAQGERTARILDRYRREFGADVPILVAGDFNGDVATDPAIAAVKAGGLTDTFDLQPKTLPAPKRITHTYHPRDGPTEAKQVDAVLASEAFRGAVIGSKVYRYRDEQGRIKPIPRTYEERSRNPSDHFLVVLRLSLKRVRRLVSTASPLGSTRRPPGP